MSGRYVIRELEGYSILLHALGGQGGNAKITTDVMVLDSHDCYRGVGYWSGEGRGNNQGLSALDMRRRYARRLVEELSV